MVRYLLIVTRTQPDLGRYLTANFAGDEKVEVIVDRRRGERRRGVQPHEPERRQGERRRQPGPEKDLIYRPLVIVRRPQEDSSSRLRSWKETA